MALRHVPRPPQPPLSPIAPSLLPPPPTVLAFVCRVPEPRHVQPCLCLPHSMAPLPTAPLILLLCFIRSLGLMGFAWFVVVSLTGGAILAPSLLSPPLYIGFAYHAPRPRSRRCRPSPLLCCLRPPRSWLLFAASLSLVMCSLVFVCRIPWPRCRLRRSFFC